MSKKKVKSRVLTVRDIREASALFLVFIGSAGVFLLTLVAVDYGLNSVIDNLIEFIGFLTVVSVHVLAVLLAIIVFVKIFCVLFSEDEQDYWFAEVKNVK